LQVFAPHTKPRILYTITLPVVGGAQSHVLELIRGFHTRFDLRLATSAVGPLTEAAQALGVSVYLLPALGRSISPRDDLRALTDCVRLFRAVNPAIVHAHSSKAGLLSRIAGRLTRVPVIFTAHGWGFKPGVPLARRGIVWASEALAAPLSARIVCVSDYDKRLAEQYRVGDKQTLVAIYNGLDSDAPLAAPEAEPVNITMTARFLEPKEQQLLIRAFAVLRSDNALLTFVGGGEELPASRALAEQLGVISNVRFLGDRSDVAELLAQSQVFVLLSRYEGFPISILEAMRAGLPVVASNVGGVSEAVQHGVNGFLTQAGDVQAVARALHTLIDQPELRRQMGATGRQRFLQEFTRERMITQTEAVYRQLLGGAPVAYA
jgi:glycosyltransferase involved in cell wall biosynthesis